MEYNKVAAKWWADKLRKAGPGNFDNVDSSSTGDKVIFLANMLAKNSLPSDEAIDLFEERLATIIKEQVEVYGSTMLSVNYGPDYILGKLAQETGVSTDGFHWKITMWIEKDKVSISAGYSAKIKTIFSE